MHSLLIFNPVSGKKEGRMERLGTIVSTLTLEGNEVTVYQTQGKGDAREYAASQKENGYDRIICCGGDGTLHEVVNGLLRQKSSCIPTLGYIPTGSANDYAKNLGITKKNALKCLIENQTMTMDIGCINGEYFNYVAAFGAFTNVSFNTPQQMKNTFGYFAYLLEGIKQLGDIKPKHIRFCIDGVEVEDDIILGMVTNAFFIAGIKNFHNNQIRLDDGCMEYLFIKYPKNVIELQTIIGQLLNEKMDERYMYYGKFQTMQMESEPMEWTLDGENGGIHEEVIIETFSGKVCIIGKRGTESEYGTEEKNEKEKGEIK